MRACGRMHVVLKSRLITSLSLQVVTSSGEEVFFKIKRNTKLSKLQGAYANKVGKDVQSIRCALFSIFARLWTAGQATS